MLSDEQLEQRLKKLDDTGDWIFMSVFCDDYESLKKLNFTDLLKIPKQYHKNLIKFFSEHKDINFKNQYSFKLGKFIEDATGLKLSAFLKFVDIKNKLNDLDKDFI